MAGGQKSKAPEPDWVWGMRAGNTAHLFVQEEKSSSFTEQHLDLDFGSSFLLLEGRQINLIEEKPETARLHL